jgi:alcohol dehydrogenase class IV
MLAPFEFATATRIRFGAGTLGELGVAAAALGTRALVVTRGDPAAGARVLELLAAQGVEGVTFGVDGEPTIALAQAGVAQARIVGCDLVIGCGGGSVLDAGKAIAVLLTNPGDPLDYLEVIGRGTPLREPPVPYIAIPTTAGTGAEVTRNAVLASPTHQVKVSLRSPLMLPRLALVDPELTHDLPPAITASTGLDALTQLIEPFVCNRPNPLTDALCRDGIVRAARSLRRAYEAGSRDPAAREDMALASLFGGLALANARLGAVHGFAAPIGGMFHAPHGAVCARLLPPVMEANLRALAARDPGHEALARYDEVARLVTGSPRAVAADGAAWVRELVGVLEVPALGAYAITADDIPALVEKAAVASSMQGNPIRLTAEEMAGILAEAL